MAGCARKGVGAESDLVEVDVIVTDKGDRPRADLGSEDFEILEDGRPQPITHFARGFVGAPGLRPSPEAPPRISSFAEEGAPRGATSRSPSTTTTSSPRTSRR